MLEGIKTNIESLIAHYESEKSQRIALQAELLRRDSELVSCKKKIEELEQQVDNLHLTEAFLTPAGNGSEAKEKIDCLIKEIDKCISLLEN